MKKLKIILRRTQAVQGSEEPSGFRRNDGERSRTITKGMTIKETLEKYPKTSSVFIKLGLYCFSCPVATEETIEQMAETYRLDLKRLLGNLNKVK